MPNTVRLAVASKDSFTREASFLDHATRRDVRYVSFGFDSLKSTLNECPASDQSQRGRADTLPASLWKHGNPDGARAVCDHTERDQSERPIGRSIGDHEGRPLALRPGVKGIAESRSTARRNRLVLQPPLRIRIVACRADQRLILHLAEAQHDPAVGHRSIRWRQLDPTTLTNSSLFGRHPGTLAQRTADRRGDTVTRSP